MGVVADGQGGRIVFDSQPRLAVVLGNGELYFDPSSNPGLIDPGEDDLTRSPPPPSVVSVQEQPASGSRLLA